MITIIFNGYSALSNFDDHEVRLRHLLQQDAMPTLEDSRHLLSVCPVCKHPWYKAGRHEYPRLTLEQLAFLGATLHVDIHSLYLLPRAFCPICSAIYLGGMFSAQEYQQHEGLSLPMGKRFATSPSASGDGLPVGGTYPGYASCQMSPEPLAESTA